MLHPLAEGTLHPEPELPHRLAVAAGDEGGGMTPHRSRLVLLVPDPRSPGSRSARSSSARWRRLGCETLADGLVIHRSTATRRCDRLICKGLIVRNTSTGSRREVTLALIANGRALVRAKTPRRGNDIRQLVAQFDDDTFRKLIDARRTPRHR